MYHNKKSNKLAFTLVELIVVIVILAILATIAFISFGSQSASARDSTRLSDLWQIWKALWVKSVSAWSYPLPDKYVNILNGTWIVWYQWEVWDSVKRQLSIWLENFKDPSDKVNYSYTVNSAKHKFQILAFLESQSSSALNFGIQSDSASATSYTSRYPYARGDNLWVILVSTGNAWLPTYTPIQDVTPGNLWVTASWVDLSSGTVVSAWVTAFVSNDLSKNWSGSLAVAVENYFISSWWKYVAPTSWLIWYWDFQNWSLADKSWNWRDLTNYWASISWWLLSNDVNWWYYTNSNYLWITDVSSWWFLLNNLTVSIWTKPNSIVSDSFIFNISWWWWSWNWIIIWVSWTKWFVRSIVNSSLKILTATTDIQQGQWQNVTITYDNNKIILYIDWIKNWEIIANWNITYNWTYPWLWLWKWNAVSWFDHYFNGSFDNFRIYNRALSDIEITNIYNSEKK